MTESKTTKSKQVRYTDGSYSREIDEQPQTAESPERIVINFGLGQTVVLGGKLGGAPSIGLKVIEHGLQVGDIVPDTLDLSISKPEVGLRFFTKEGLKVFKDGIDRMYEKFDEIADKEKTLTYQVWIHMEENREPGI